MKKQHFLTIWLFLIGLLLSNSNIYAQFAQTANLPLVASTDFKVVGGENDAYHSFDELNDFGGFITPTFKANFSLPDSLVSTEKKSSFFNGQHYAITSNPSKLDPLRFYDNENSGECGVVICDNKTTINRDTVFSMEVTGLKNNGQYRILVEICNPHSTAYLSTSGAAADPHLISGYNPSLKIGVNNTYLGGKDCRPGSKEGSCSTVELTSPITPTNDFGPIQDNKLTVNFYIQQMNKGEAIMIKSIKVYAEIDPKITGVREVCAGGESAIISLESKYQGCEYQWYRDGKSISGATELSYTHISGNNSMEETHEYYIEVTTPEGKKIKSNVHKITDEICCTSDDGTPMSHKIIWQDDFGTFTGKGHYWVWDYSDINNPVKVQKTTTDGWTYRLSEDEEKRLAASYPEDGIPYEEGSYSVAANITSTFDGATDGTMWEWQAYMFNGKLPRENGYKFAPDHTYGGSAYGAMLVLNCGNEPDSTIYERTIRNLCNKEVTVKCYINNWSAAEKPVNVYMRITDLNSGAAVESKPVERYSTTSGLDWFEVKKKITLTGVEPALKFEIVSKAGGEKYNQEGNDLLLDDIQIWTCTPPSVQLYFDNQLKKDTTSCDGDDVSLFVNETSMAANFYRDEKRYIFQYTTGNPEDNSTWKPVPGSKISDNPTLKNMSAVFEEIDSEEKVYFRVVLGSRETLEDDFGLNYIYNPYEACASYTVSAPIEALKLCAECTEPDSKIKIKSNKKATGKKNNKDVIDLCYGESVTLSQAADITPDKAGWAPDFKGFSIKWFESENPSNMSDAKTVLNNVVASKTVNYDDKSLGGTELPVLLYAVDAMYPNGSCNTADTIYIRFNEAPDAEFRNPNTEFCEGEGSGMVDLTLTNGNVSDYTIHWWKGDGDVSGKPIVDDLDEDFFEGLKSANDGIFTYQLVDNKTGCTGEFHYFEVIVNAIPDAPKDEYIQYTINGDSSYILTTEKFAQTLDASYNLIWFMSEAEPNPKGSKSVEIDRSVATTNPYVFYIAYQGDYCYSKRAKVEVLISSLDNVESIAAANDDEIVNVYTVSGALVKANVKKSEALKGLSNGSYLVGDQKVIVK